jgi:hypothetical protein
VPRVACAVDGHVKNEPPPRPETWRGQAGGVVRSLASVVALCVYGRASRPAAGEVTRGARLRPCFTLG